MKSCIGSLIGLVLSISVGAEPLLEGRVRLAAGEPAAGVQVRLFDLTDLREWVGATTDEAGYFALPLRALPGAAALPARFDLGPNYPNPFNPSTVIPYQLLTSTHVRLEVFNVLGQRIATLVDGEQSAGFHTAQWDGTDAAGRAVGAGVYIYRLSGGGLTVSRRMVLVDGQAGTPEAASSGVSLAAGAGAAEVVEVYGLTVSGPGLVPYVDPAFRVAAGMAPVDLVVETQDRGPRAKVAVAGIVGDVDNNAQVDVFDALLVILYSGDASVVMPNNGDISLGDVNADGQTDRTDAGLIAAYLNEPSNPTLPLGIGKLSASADSDREALIALYNATDGDNWADNTNWLSDAPLGEWYGVWTDANGRVTDLFLSRNGLSGQIPSQLGTLTNLEQLVLYENRLTGTIPLQLGTLTNLRTLSLGENQLTGTIPSQLGTLTNLEQLVLYENRLTGTIPSQLGTLTNLRELSLSKNQLSGSIPSELGGLHNLIVLDIIGNRLTGTIPSQLGTLTNLAILRLSNNRLTGTIPSQLGTLTNLQWLTLSDNELSGSIPSSLGDLTNLTLLRLGGNQLSGCVPAGLRGVETNDLDRLDLPDCGLSDTVPKKTELKHPKVGSALDDLIARIEAGEISEEEAAQEAPLYRGKSVAVTIYLSSNVDGVVSFLKANGVSPRNVGEDYIEAFVPVLLLAETSEQSGVLWVQVIQPPQPPESFEASSTVPGNGPDVHGSPAWNQAGYRGQGIKVGIIDVGFEGIRGLLGSELPQTVKGRCYRVLVDESTNDLQLCENGKNHGTIVAETVMDIAPDASCT